MKQQPPAARTSDAWTRFCGLHAAGRLTELYLEGPQLLSQLDPDQRYRAGRLLRQLSTATPRPELEQPVVNAFLTSNFTCNSLTEFMTAELARHGMLLNMQTGAFNQYRFDLGAPDSRLYASSPDLTLCVLDAHVVVDTMTGHTPQDHQIALDAAQAQVCALAGLYLENAAGMLVLNTLPLPRDELAQVLDRRARMAIGAAWRDFNSAMLRFASQHERLIVIDMDVLLTDVGPLSDAAAAEYAQAYFRDDVLAAYAREVAHCFKSVRGRASKCLVLDLDGTLWGGILGDAGEAGIELDGAGATFGRFQRVIQRLASQGVLLAVCSKNDDGAVRDVLRHHPNMLLRETDFAAIHANWEPKSDNLRALAAGLNIATDSLVFVDDSAFECGQVRALLPEVVVVQLSEEPAEHVRRLLEDDWFGSSRLTAEDAARTAMYRADGLRRSLKEGAASIDDYLRDLNITLNLFLASSKDAARISQLTLRTNQFNLTTMRMDAAEVLRRLQCAGDLTVAMRAADRYGEQGLIGAMFIHRRAGELVVENMLLSCRVFSRGIETAALAAILGHAKGRGMQRLIGRYAPSGKNQRFADFYARHGFIERGESCGVREYVRDVGCMLAPPPHVAVSLQISEGAS